MGFLAKSATKKRIQPIAGPLNPALISSGPWTTNGGVPTGALIRSAVLAVDLTGARSNSLRGTTSKLAAPFVGRASNLWVQMWQPREWNFILGINNGTGNIAADWSVKLQITDSAAQVSTPNYLTKDDVLVHGEQHDALRSELLRALSLGTIDDPGSETELGQASLGAPQEFASPTPAPAKIEFSLRTGLAPEAVWPHLNLVGHRLLERNEQHATWGLGLPSNDGIDRASLHVEPGLLKGSAVIGSEGAFGRRVAKAGLLAFVGRALFLLGREDPDVRYEGPEEWARGWQL